jgi:hypothetical protein
MEQSYEICSGGGAPVLFYNRKLVCRLWLFTYVKALIHACLHVFNFQNKLKDDENFLAQYHRVSKYFQKRCHENAFSIVIPIEAGCRRRRQKTSGRRQKSCG